jgi:hypothetical protein
MEGEMKLKLGIAIAAIAAMFAAPAMASHNRGSVLIPSIDANGSLTINATSFWRTTFVDRVRNARVTGPGIAGTRNLGVAAGTVDTSDSRYTRVDQSVSTSLAGLGAGTYTISWGNCCRVGGLPNGANGNFGTTSTIFWDGQNASNPITFDINNIQPEVVRGSAYSDNLGATSANGDVLSYDDTVLTVGITSQATGFNINGTGQIDIDAVSTATYVDNAQAQNIGADIAFSGEIKATSGGRQTTGTVQFDWVFDGVAQGANQAPDVADVVINATVGATINTNIGATDPQALQNVTLSFVSFTGPGGAVGNSTFIPGAPGNPTSPTAGAFGWNSTGFGVGTYIALISGTDGSLTDQGSITINLTAGPSPVPLPAGIYLLGAALAGLGAIRRRRRK